MIKRTLKDPVALTGGLNLDLDPMLIEANQSPNLQNIRLFADHIESLPGYVALGDDLPIKQAVTGVMTASRIMGVATWRLLDGTYKSICCDASNAYVYDSTNKIWQIITQGHVISTCDAAWTAAASVTQANDTTVKRRGTGSIKLTVADAFTTGVAGYFNTASSIDCSGDTYLHFWIRSNVDHTANQLAIVLSQAPAVASEDVVVNCPAMSKDTWYRIILAMTGTRDSIDSVGLKVVADVGAQIVYIDDIRTVKQFTGDADDYFHFASVPNPGAELFFLTNGIDQIQQWNGTADTLSDLTGAGSGITINTAKYLIDYSTRLLLGHTTESGAQKHQRVRRSNKASTAVWDTGTAGFNDLVDEESPLTGMARLADVVAVYKDNCIYNYREIGGATVVQYPRVITGVGAIGNTACEIEGNLNLFLGSDYCVYQYNGSGLVALTGKLMQKWLRDNINDDYKERCWAFVEPVMKEYYLAVPWGYTSETSKLLVFNYEFGVWSVWNLAMNCGCVYLSYATESWDSQTSYYSTETRRWSDVAEISGRASPLFADRLGYVYVFGRGSSFNGSVIDAYIETKDYTFSTFGTKERVNELRFVAKGVTVTVSYSTDGGAIWKNPQIFTLSGQYQEYKYGVGFTPTEKIRWRFRSSGTDTIWSLLYVQPMTIGRVR